MDRNCHSFDSFVMAIKSLFKFKPILFYFINSDKTIIRTGDKYLQCL